MEKYKGLKNNTGWAIAVGLIGAITIGGILLNWTHNGYLALIGVLVGAGIGWLIR